MVKTGSKYVGWRPAAPNADCTSVAVAPAAMSAAVTAALVFYPAAFDADKNHGTLHGERHAAIAENRGPRSPVRGELQVLPGPEAGIDGCRRPLDKPTTGALD